MRMIVSKEEFDYMINAPVSNAVIELIEQGVKLAREFHEKGYVRIKLENKN